MELALGADVTPGVVRSLDEDAAGWLLPEQAATSTSSGATRALFLAIGRRVREIGARAEPGRAAGTLDDDRALVVDMIRLGCLLDTTRDQSPSARSRRERGGLERVCCLDIEVKGRQDRRPRRDQGARRWHRRDAVTNGAEGGQPTVRLMRNEGRRCHVVVVEILDRWLHAFLYDLARLRDKGVEASFEGRDLRTGRGRRSVAAGP